MGLDRKCSSHIPLRGRFRGHALATAATTLGLAIAAAPAPVGAQSATHVSGGYQVSGLGTTDNTPKVYTLRIIGTDGVGNTATYKKTFQVDEHAPVLAFNSPPAAIAPGTSFPDIVPIYGCDTACVATTGSCAASWVRSSGIAAGRLSRSAARRVARAT